MFWAIIKDIARFFKIRNTRSGYSIKGFWGQIKHYNKDHVQIGYSVKGFFCLRKRYNMDGKLISYTMKNFWGGYNTYDAEGNLIRRSYKNIFGGYTTFNRAGKKISESYKSFWGGMNHYDVENPDPNEIIVPVKRRDRNKITNITNADMSSGNKSAGYARNLDNNGDEKDDIDSYGNIENAAIGSENAKNSGTFNSSNITKSSNNTKGSSTIISSNNTKGSSTTKSLNDTKSIDQVQRTEELTIMRDIEQYSNMQNNKIVIDGKLEFYSSVAEYIKERYDSYDSDKIENNKLDNSDVYDKILVISYKDMKEFPAIIYKKENCLVAEPLIKDDLGNIEKTSNIVINKEDINTARYVSINLDDEKMNNEFAALKLSELAREYEELMPDYEFDFDGYSRVQYELSCGLIVTEKSFKIMKGLVYEEYF